MVVSHKALQWLFHSRDVSILVDTVDILTPIREDLPSCLYLSDYTAAETSSQIQKYKNTNVSSANVPSMNYNQIHTDQNFCVGWQSWIGTNTWQWPQ